MCGALLLTRFRHWHGLIGLAFAATWLLFFSLGLHQARTTCCPRSSRRPFWSARSMRASTWRAREKAKTARTFLAWGAALILAACVAFLIASGVLLEAREFLGLPAFVSAVFFVALSLMGVAVALPLVEGARRGRRVMRYAAAARGGRAGDRTVTSAPPVPASSALPALPVHRRVLPHLPGRGPARAAGRRRARAGASPCSARRRLPMPAASSTRSRT